MDEAAKDTGTSIVVAVRDNKTYTVAGRDNRICRQAVAGRDNKRYRQAAAGGDKRRCGWKDNKRYSKLWLEGQQKIQQAVAGRDNKRYSKLWLEETTKDTACCG